MDNIYICIVEKKDVLIDNSIFFPSNITREESKKAYYILKYMLSVLNIPFNINIIKYNNNGKPYIDNSHIKFNYSHSKNYIACAISDCNLGIDIEDKFKISKKASEIYLNGITTNHRKEWVKKEAYCKLLGDFDNYLFKNINNYNYYHYDINNRNYDCILFYEDNNKTIKIIDYEVI